MRTWVQGAVLSVLLSAAAVQAKTLSDAEMLRYLKHANVATAVDLISLQVWQQGRLLPLYDQTGHEEVYVYRDQRPIFAPAEGSGPFQRRNRFWVRLDRSSPVRVELSLERVTAVQPDRLQRQPIESAFYAPGQGEDKVLVSGPQGHFQLDLKDPRSIRSLRWTLSLDLEPHELELILFDQRRPFTLEH